MSQTTSALTDSSLLENRDYTVILARTATDPAHHPPGFAQLWDAAQSSVLKLVQHCEAFDPDGITLYVSCCGEEGVCQFQKYEQVTSANLTRIIQENYPPDAVNLKLAIDAALTDYFTRKAAGSAKTNGEMILVLLDGEPSDRLAIGRAIVEASQKIERDEELGIGFVQIGQDPMAQGFFRALDNNLKTAGAKFDIVHTQILETIQPDSLTSFLMSVLTD